MQESVVERNSVEPRHWPAGQGWRWIVAAFDLFKQAPGIWVLLMLLCLVVQGLVNLLPLGGLAMSIINPLITAGLLLGCRDLERGEALNLGHLLAGFRSDRAGPLALLGLCSLLMFVLVAILGGAVGWIVLSAEQLTPSQVEPGTAVLGLLLAVLLLLPVMLALWFATALVALHEMDVIPALGASLRACLRNLGSLSVLGLVLIPLAILALIPMGLGLLVLMPVVFAANYRGYVDIFTAPAPEARLIE